MKAFYPGRLYKLCLLLVLAIGGMGMAVPPTGLYTVTKGAISFKSEAPLEIIQARSEKLAGLIDTGKRNFAFSVLIRSFEGFNSELQREHFNENYLESSKYAKATFAGKIQEEVDLQKDGTYTVTAKGRLNIHGVEQDRTIRSKVTVKNGQLHLESDFSVKLADHNIQIPTLVSKKLAEVIDVKLNAELLPKQP